MSFLGELVRHFAQVTYDFEAELLRVFRSSVMSTGKSNKTLRKATKANRNTRMLKYLLDSIIRLQVIAAHPYTLSHQERIVIDMLTGDNLIAEFQIFLGHVDILVHDFVELLDIAFGFQRHHRQIERRESKVTTASAFFGAIDIANHARTAAHGRNNAVRIARLVILEIIRCIHVHEIREQALCADFAGPLEQVVIRVAGVVIYAGFQLEYGNRENRSLTIAQSSILRLKEPLGNQTAFRRSIHTEVNGAERNLCARAAMKRIEVMKHGFHSLLGFFLDIVHGIEVRFLYCFIDDTHGIYVILISIKLSRDFLHFINLVFAVSRDTRMAINRRFSERGDLENFWHVFHRHLDRLMFKFFAYRFTSYVIMNGPVCFAKVPCKGLLEADVHVWCQSKVQYVNGLAAEHIVLIALNCYTSQRGSSSNAIWLTEEPVASAKATCKQLRQVNLAAIKRNKAKIFVMDVDIVFFISCSDFRRKCVIIDICFGPLGAQLQHNAHGAIGIDVGVVTLEVHLCGVLEEQVVILSHKFYCRITALVVLFTIDDIFFSCLEMFVAHQGFFYDVLNFFHTGRVIILQRDIHLQGNCHQFIVSHFFPGAFVSSFERGNDFLGVVFNQTSVTLGYILNAHFFAFFPSKASKVFPFAKA